MTYSREAHELLDSALEVLKTKKGKYAHSYMLGLLMPNIDLLTAQRLAELINKLDTEEDK
jgi:hypothetical protein